MGKGIWGRRWLRRLIIGTAGTLAFITVVGFLIVPLVARRVTEKQLGDLLGRRVAVARVRCNPFALSLTVEGFQIFEPDGQTLFVGFSRLYVNAQLASVWKRAPVVKEIRLESPRLNVVRLKATPDAWADTTSYNFSDILARLAALPKSPPPPPDPSAGPALFSVNNIHISDGTFSFDDRPLTSKHVIAGLDLGIPFVSTLPLFVDTFVEPGLRLQIDGTPFAFAGRTKPFKDSQETTIELRADDFDLTRYLPYVPVPLRFDVASALLDLALDVSFVRSRADAPTLTVKGRVALEKLALREKNAAPLVSFDTFEVLIGKADVTGQSFTVDRVRLAGLDVHARRLPGGALNLEKLAPAAPAGEGKKAPPKAAPAPAAATKKAGAAGAEPRFAVHEFALENATLHFHDEAVRPAMDVAVEQFAVSVRGLSNAPGARATVTTGLRAVPGGTVKHEGTLTLEPLTAAGTVTVDGIEPGRFAAYYRDLINFELARASLKLGTGYRFQQAVSGPPAVQLNDAFVEVSDLLLRKRAAGDLPEETPAANAKTKTKGKGKTARAATASKPRPQDEFFKLRDLAVRGVAVDLSKQTVAVGEISTHDGRVRAERNAAGVVDLTTLVPPPPTATPGKTPPRTSAPPSPPPAAAAAPPAVPWSIALKRLTVDGWSARFEDHAVTPTAITTVSPIAVKVTDFSTAPGARVGVDVRLGLNKEGHLAVTGNVGLQPLTGNLKVDLRTLEILPLQPYFADQVNLTVTDGKVSVKLDTKFTLPEATGKGPPPEPRVALTGNIDIDSLATVDGVKHEPFLSWRSFHIGGLDVATAPLKIAVHDIALTDFYSRLMITPDAHFNVQDIAAPPRPGAAPPPPPIAAAPAAKDKTAAPKAPPGPPVTIGQVTLQGGHVSFSDHLIRPNYSAELTELGGRLSGLSSDASTQADIDLRGAVDHSGTLSIVGKINPLSNNLFVDVQVSLKDFELPPTSPYAAKYAGYGISKGKLGVSLDYHIANKKLDAKNRLVLDQFTFGDKVKSPDATNLPVRLAVAILKDRHGVIDLEVPIAGSLDDPEFKVGHAILKVLGNLIVKAVTAPFSLIAAAFGGGDQLSHLDFPPGLATVDSRAQAKIRTLAKALQERPGLSFEIEGGADPQRDREDLRRHLFDQKLRAQRLLEAVKTTTAEAAAPPAPDAPITPEERPHLIELAYKAETFAKPKNFLGIEKGLPVPEMEKMLLTHLNVDDDALRALAQKRANAVLAALSKIAPEGATRLFLVTPHLGPKDGAAGNSVELRLKKD